MLFIIGVDFSHGISMVPWITWLSRLIPEKLRGRYFSIESIMGNIGIISLSYVAGVIIGAQKNDFRFGIYLAVGAAASWLSMYCLSRIPSVPVIKSAPDGKRVNPFDLRWIPDLLRITPFRRMLYVVILNGLGLSMGAFGILFATEDLHQRQDILMKLLALSTIGSLLAVYIWGSLSDRFGSRPVMTLAYRLVLLSIIPGFLITLFMPMNLIFLYTVGTIAGFIGTVGMVGYSINGYRYLLGCIPKEKMVQGSVLYMLILQLASGIGPPVWGSLLKLGQNLNIVIGPFHIHRYTCLNFAMLLMVFVTLRMMRRLENRESDATPNDVLIYAIRHTPQTIRSIVSGAGQKLSKSVKPQPEK